MNEQRRRFNITEDATHNVSTHHNQPRRAASLPDQLENDIKAYIAKAMDNLQVGRLNENHKEDIRLSEPIHRSSDKEEQRPPPAAMDISDQSKTPKVNTSTGNMISPNSERNTNQDRRAHPAITQPHPDSLDSDPERETGRRKHRTPQGTTGPNRQGK